MKIKLHDGIRDSSKVLTQLNGLLDGYDLKPEGGEVAHFTTAHINGREHGIAIHFQAWDHLGHPVVAADSCLYSIRFEVANIRNGTGVVVHEWVDDYTGRGRHSRTEKFGPDDSDDYIQAAAFWLVERLHVYGEYQRGTSDAIRDAEEAKGIRLTDFEVKHLIGGARV